MSAPAIKIPPPSGAPPDPVNNPTDRRPFQTLIATRPGRDPRRETALLVLLAALVHLALIGSLTFLNISVPRAAVAPEEEVLLFSFAEAEPAGTPDEPIVYHRAEPLPSPLTPPVTAPLPSLAPRALPPRFPLQGSPQLAPGGAGQGEVAGARPGRPLRPGEVLRPQLLDPRLWAPKSEILGSREGEEARYRARLYSRIEAFNDSIAADAEAKRRGLDWTIKGENGDRWGISPEGIHLGKLTLPAPQMSPGGERGAEARRTAADWKEIEQSADRARVRNTFNERAKAIRTRKDQERSERKGEPVPAPPPPPSPKEPAEKPTT